MSNDSKERIVERLYFDLGMAYDLGMECEEHKSIEIIKETQEKGSDNNGQ